MVSRESWFSLLTTPDKSGARAFAGEGDGQNDDRPTYDFLLAQLQSHRGQSVVDKADQQCAKHRPYDRAITPEQARAAQYHGRYHRQLVALAPREASGLESSGVEHPGQRCDDPGHQEHSARTSPAPWRPRRGPAAAGPGGAPLWPPGPATPLRAAPARRASGSPSPVSR